MDTDREKLNRAFHELGLPFQWDESTWRHLAGLPDLRSRLRFFLEANAPHLLAAYDAEFLGRLVEERVAKPLGPAPAMEAYAGS